MATPHYTAYANTPSFATHIFTQHNAAPYIYIYTQPIQHNTASALFISPSPLLSCLLVSHCAQAGDQGCLEVVKILLDNGGKVDATNGKGCTPLYFAVRGGYLPVVQLLIKVPLIFPSRRKDK